MTVRDALASTATQLRIAGIDSANLDADVLLAKILRTTKTDLYARPERVLTPIAQHRLQIFIARRKRHEPVSYILGTKEFFGRDFLVTRDVLIPRPETEHAVEEALRRLPKNTHATVADVGTGSGCIGITIVKERPNVRVIATDISQKAISVAKKNARRLHATSRITFRPGNLLEPLKGLHVDLIVANLPYVPADEVKENPDLAYEPLIALRGQMTPERTFGLFVRQWYEREDRPTAILEIHPLQTPLFFKERERIGVSLEVKKDLAGRDRVIILSYRSLSL